MIKRNNKILVGALALLLCLTVGYALFSDTLTINGTATAQGNFSLKYECVGAADVEEGIGTCEVNGNTITTTSVLTKPTDKGQFVVTITNTGTIPVVLKTVDSDNNYSADESGNPVEGDSIYLDIETLLFAEFSMVNNKCPGYSCTGDTEMENAEITIEPNGSIELLINHYWQDSELLKEVGFDVSTQPVPPAEGFKMNYNIILGFEQITAE